MQNTVLNALREAQAALDALLKNDEAQAAIARAGDLMADAVASGNSIFSCGNGGSLCDAMHFAEEMTGRYRKDRPAYPATAIADASHLACVANDYGYEYVFSRYVEAHGRPGDVLLAMGNSDVPVGQYTGKRGVPLTDEIADVAVVTSGGRWADRVQELHIKCIHIWIEWIERRLAPQNYAEGD